MSEWKTRVTKVQVVRSQGGAPTTACLVLIYPPGPDMGKKFPLAEKRRGAVVPPPAPPPKTAPGLDVATDTEASREGTLFPQSSMTIAGDTITGTTTSACSRSSARSRRRPSRSSSSTRTTPWSRS